MADDIGGNSANGEPKSNTPAKEGIELRDDKTVDDAEENEEKDEDEEDKDEDDEEGEAEEDGLGEGSCDIGRDDFDEDDEDDGEDEDEDEDDETPEGLKKDLEKTLSMNFNFKGKFAFASKIPNAPNPGLQISPLGIIGLPLCERDAQSIKAIASQAPFGLGDKLVVDTNVRHTWEIEPADTITFANPAWTSFLELVVKTACTELGVIPSSKPPKCELYKLLLYEAGSHFLPHQDTEKAPGMFATIVIVLPSFYSGGQVCVSHGSEKQTFDFSSDGFSTSMLTWYADVVHEVKPITSGYRMALTYNLIQEETSLPLPSVPSTSTATIMLKSILHKWSNGTYNNVPRWIAYVLSHEYSYVDLGLGAMALKGTDAQMVKVMREVAMKEGIAIALAELECHITGSASEDFDPFDGYNKRRCYYDEYDDYGGDPSMGEEMSRTMSISSLVDLDGKHLIEKGKISLSRKELIPSDPFKGKEPDDQEYEGYQGNYPGDVQYWYHRVVVVLHLQRNAHDLLLEAGGAGYAISQLKARDGNEPTSLDRKFATYVADHLKSYNMQYRLGNDREWAPYIFNLAVQWSDSALWLKAAYKIGGEQNLNAIGDERLSAAWNVFGFEALRPLFEKAVNQSRSLKTQLELIDSLQRRARSEEDRVRVSTWCDEQRALALTHIKVPVKDDVPIFIQVLKSKGMQFFIDTIQPQLSQHYSIFEFLLAFVRALHEEDALLSNSSAAAEAALKQTVHFCLARAISEWGSSLPRAKELIDVFLLTDEIDLCKTLFTLFLQVRADVGIKFKDYFIPLVPWLRHSLNSRNLPLNAQPFGDFFRYLIEMYLVTFVGAKTGNLHHTALRKIGCGCETCRELDNFLFSTQAMKQFRYNQSVRTHLEHRLRNAQDLATYTTIRQGSPHILQVTKRPDVVAAATWEGRQKAAKSFIASFGGDAAIRLIMGPKYIDVTKALSGEKAYTNVAKPFSSPAPTSVDPVQSTSSATTQVSSAPSKEATGQLAAAISELSASASTNKIAGMKRKNLGFIDISGSP